MYWTVDSLCTTKHFWKLLFKLMLRSKYLRFFFPQIGELFELQWVFEVCLKINKMLSLKENVVDFGILLIVWRLTVPQIIDQFGCKRCQKKSKDVGTFYNNFSKIFCCIWAVCYQKFYQHILMLCPGRFILVESVEFALFL